MHEQQVAEDAEDHERDRRHQRLRVARGEGVQRVRDHGRGGDDRDELVDELERVALEHRPPRSLAGADEHELPTALRQREEEREQGGAEQQPGRDPHVHRGRARRRADHEQPADREDVQQHDVLEPEAVAELDRRERDEKAQRREAQPRARAERRSSEYPGERDRQAGRQLPARDRPLALDRMETVVLPVAQVVDDVGRARERAVGREAHDGLRPARGVAELRREDDPREDEQVLRPLPRPHRRERRSGQRAPARQLDQASGGNGHSPDSDCY